MLLGRRLPDRTMPAAPGDYSCWPMVPRPPYGLRDEWYAQVPTGELVALIPEVHTVTVEPDGSATVSPSIVRGAYHGALTAGVWS